MAELVDCSRTAPFLPSPNFDGFVYSFQFAETSMRSAGFYFYLFSAAQLQLQLVRASQCEFGRGHTPAGAKVVQVPLGVFDVNSVSK